MSDFRLCLEVQGLAVDDTGRRAPGYLQLSCPVKQGQETNFDYAAFIRDPAWQDKVIEQILRSPGIRMLHLKREACRIISPEEYDRMTCEA